MPCQALVAFRKKPCAMHRLSGNRYSVDRTRTAASVYFRLPRMPWTATLGAVGETCAAGSGGKHARAADAGAEAGAAAAAAAAAAARRRVTCCS